ncbi:hypothetical protein PH210_23910 [Paenibacillus sp. BSR1-1]|uniref:hypothetical protein n=1 Tax=Paenibacillus sp. BSR1-1 TaxID=3020845 RepID=UPI0025B14236|nr:hypothetical protein [Paenibacillus sp. BSR1-1]MDN3019221.1 hypothetical protein [Paenibacillus sp. BSR1-1]
MANFFKRLKENTEVANYGIFGGLVLTRVEDLEKSLNKADHTVQSVFNGKAGLGDIYIQKSNPYVGDIIGRRIGKGLIAQHYGV